MRAGGRSVKAGPRSVTIWIALLASLLLPTVQAQNKPEAIVNAPLATVWAEAVGGAALHLGQVLRLNGLDCEVLAFEPQHMLAVRTRDSAAPPGLRRGWTVIYFNAIAGVTTHVRHVNLGLDEDAEARAYIESRQRALLDAWVKRHRPGCARCERPQ